MRWEAPKPEPSAPLADDTPLAQMWLAKLRGKAIRQFIRGGGVGERRHLLKADGGYEYSSNFAASADVGPFGEAPSASASVTSRKARAGRWRIVDRSGAAFLQVTSEDGVRLFALTQGEGAWFLDGEKAFAAEP